jgi:CDP-diacylglycerol--glycerol-3-phosphate 3-phosphatidyltransferase
MNTTSKFGARFDSIADIIFMTVMFIVLFSIVKIPVEIFIWIVIIASIRITSMLIVFHKHHIFAILHTYANKATGAVIFCFPMLYQFVDVTVLWCLVCVVASVSSIEELLIHITSKELIVDKKGIKM